MKLEDFNFKMVFYVHQKTKKMRIGRIDVHDKEAKEKFAEGLLIVNDMILPDASLALISNVTLIGDYLKKHLTPTQITALSKYNPEMVIEDSWRTHWLKEAVALNAKLTKFGVGCTFEMPVGDGCAHYVVTKVAKTMCDVEWRGFSADNWVDRVFGYGGKFRIKDVKPLCEPGPSLCAWLDPIDYVVWPELEKLGAVPKGMLA
jgi:hypothetical protein